MKYYAAFRLSENIAETPEGFLICIGVPIARTGDMIYADGETPLETDSEGKIIISRDASEVFRPETIASFEGKPVTISHPSNPVTPNNWSQLAKGVIQNVRRGEGNQKEDLIADVLITDSIAIGLVKNGLREVSCGYDAEYVQTDEGRGIQTNIIGNHLALVKQGRAGSSYAIQDHKSKGVNKMKMTDKIKAIFAKAQDEAMKVAEDASGPEVTSENKKVGDAGAYDELVKLVKDMSEKVAAMAKPKDEKSDEKKDDKKDDKAKDEEVDSSLEDRLKALEMAVAKLLERESKEDEVPVGDEEEEIIEDDDFEESTMVGDTASRAEILAPGIEHTKDIKAKALKAAYATKEGKKVIESLTGGKAPTFDSNEKVDTLFIAASELLKAQRTTDFSKSKHVTDSNSYSSEMSAEKMNEINAKHYARMN